MAATSYSQLYEFTGVFEDAARAALLSAGIGSVAPRSPETVEREIVSVSFVVGPADGERIATDGTVQYGRYAGCELAVSLEWPRIGDADGVTDDELYAAWQTRDAAMRATAASVRALFRESARPIDPVWYEVTRLQPSGEQRGINSDTGCDTITMRWAVDFAIRSSAWPVA